MCVSVDAASLADFHPEESKILDSICSADEIVGEDKVEPSLHPTYYKTNQEPDNIH
jgi:hypothetical protein